MTSAEASAGGVLIDCTVVNDLPVVWLTSDRVNVAAPDSVTVPVSTSPG